VLATARSTVSVASSMSIMRTAVVKVSLNEGCLSASQKRATVDKSCRYRSVRAKELTAAIKVPTSMWANAQRDGRPAEYRWRPLFNAAKFV